MSGLSLLHQLEVQPRGGDRGVEQEGGMMIFKSKRALEEEVMRKAAEIEEKNRIDRGLFELRDQVRELTYRLDRLEDKVYGPKPGQVPVNSEVVCREP